MVDFNGLATIFATFFVVAASPGPATLAVSTASAASGRKTGMFFGAGLALGLAFWGIIAATGLGALLQTTTYLLTSLKIAGGLYLIWLAYKSARSAAQRQTNFDKSDDVKSHRAKHCFKRGLILNLSNPKAVFAWIATLSVGLPTDHSVLNITIATFGCALIGMIIYAVYALAFSLPMVMQCYAKLRRWVDGVVATLFATAGLALIRSAWTRS